MPSAKIIFDVNNVDEKIGILVSEEPYVIKNKLVSNLRDLPDVFFLEGEKSIGVDTIREVGSKIVIAPNVLDHKYIICKDCHLLTEASQNALLKHLEQTYEYLQWIFFTQSKYEYKLLKTLKSRFVLIYESDSITYEDNIINTYIDKIKNKHFDYDELDLDTMLLALYKLYEFEEVYILKIKWLKFIQRVIKIKAFEQRHLRWSNPTLLAMIFTH